MARAITKIISVNGFTNLGAALRTAGYNGGSTPSMLVIYNTSGTVPVYLHVTDVNVTTGLTGTDGLPILINAPSDVFTSDRGSGLSSLDLNNTFLFTASAVNVKVLVIGT